MTKYIFFVHFYGQEYININLFIFDQEYVNIITNLLPKKKSIICQYFIH